MPRLMVVTNESQYNYPKTIQKLEEAIIAAGWSHKGTTHMRQEILQKTGEDVGADVGVVQLCKGSYAAPLLKEEKARFVSYLMPCFICVWEGDDQKVFVSKMNSGLVAKIFGGAIFKMMSAKVVSDEERILKGIVRQG